MQPIPTPSHWVINEDLSLPVGGWLTVAVNVAALAVRRTYLWSEGLWCIRLIEFALSDNT